MSNDINEGYIFITGLDQIQQNFDNFPRAAQDALTVAAKDIYGMLLPYLKEEPPQASGVRYVRGSGDTSLPQGWDDAYSSLETQSDASGGILSGMENFVPYSGWLQNKETQRTDGGFSVWAQHDTDSIVAAHMGEIDDILASAGDEMITMAGF